tara:strand:- start:1057 stop:3315 length:2259 start_codon:yes stop_codon:yes gene_type:complete
MDKDFITSYLKDLDTSLYGSPLQRAYGGAPKKYNHGGEHLPVAEADATNVAPVITPEILPWENTGMPEDLYNALNTEPNPGIVYNPLIGNNPNKQWISGAANQNNSSNTLKQKTQDYNEAWISAVTPIPILEGMQLTAKGAKLPGIIDDAIIKPVISGVKSIKSFIKPKFESTIKWKDFNKAIPENKELLDEYHLIEQTAKENGTWMKNVDGSDFVGSPEQFVQANSNNFKSAYPDGYESVYRGVDNAGPNPLRSVGKSTFYKNKVDHRDNMTGLFSGDKSVGGYYGDEVYNLAMRNSPNSLYLEGLGVNWGDLSNIGISKKMLKKNIDNLKKQIKDGEGFDNNSASSGPARLKSYENFYNNYDEIVSNPTYKKLVLDKENWLNPIVKRQGSFSDPYSTDNLAQFLQKEGLDNIQINYIDDGIMGKTNISNQIPGNYLKNLQGNNGMFDLTNKDMYRKYGGEIEPRDGLVDEADPVLSWPPSEQDLDPNYQAPIIQDDVTKYTVDKKGWADLESYRTKKKDGQFIMNTQNQLISEGFDIESDGNFGNQTYNTINKSLVNAQLDNYSKDNFTEDQFLDQVWKESGGDRTVVSPKGAMGIAQFLPSTFKELKEKGEIPPTAKITDDAASVLAQRVYMDKLYEGKATNSGNISSAPSKEEKQARAFAAYNWGPTNFDEFWDHKLTQEEKDAGWQTWYTKTNSETEKYVLWMMDKNKFKAERSTPYRHKKGYMTSKWNDVSYGYDNFITKRKDYRY